MNFFGQLKQIPRWVCWDFEAYKAWDIEAAKCWDALSKEERTKNTFNKKWIKNPHKRPLHNRTLGVRPQYKNNYEIRDSILSPLMDSTFISNKERVGCFKSIDKENQ